MFAPVRHWFDRRRMRRAQVKQDARELIGRDGVRAYHSAQLPAARARAQGDIAGFLHWARVAAEVAWLSPHADMDSAVVKRIVDEEMRRYVVG
jgi:hypothetical protein